MSGHFVETVRLVGAFGRVDRRDACAPAAGCQPAQVVWLQRQPPNKSTPANAGVQTYELISNYSLGLSDVSPFGVGVHGVK